MLTNLFRTWAYDEIKKQRQLLAALENAKFVDHKNNPYAKGIDQMIQLRKHIIELIENTINRHSK